MDTNPNAKLSEDQKKLIVPGEGSWTVNSDGTITYRVENESIIVDPTPISYSVADKSGHRLETNAKIILRKSVVGGVTDTIEDCEAYESNVSIYKNWNIVLVIILGSIFGFLFFRREKS